MLANLTPTPTLLFYQSSGNRHDEGNGTIVKLVAALGENIHLPRTLLERFWAPTSTAAGEEVNIRRGVIDLYYLRDR